MLSYYLILHFFFPFIVFFSVFLLELNFFITMLALLPLNSVRNRTDVNDGIKGGRIIFKITEEIVSGSMSGLFLDFYSENHRLVGTLN